MNVLDMIFDYMEEKGVSYESEADFAKVGVGAKLYLKEAGIAEEETRAYHMQFVKKHLSKIAPEDLKDYFLAYPVFSKVNQILIQCRTAPSEENRAQLLALVNQARKLSVGEKYLPMDEIMGMLGEKA